MRTKRPDGPPQDYLIFHPDRARHLTAGTARVAGTHRDWHGEVWADRTTAQATLNEDPFIWTQAWLYSYCHATQLRRVRQPQSFVQAGSRLFFCEAKAAKLALLKVDTVFKVAQAVRWTTPGQIPTEFDVFGEGSPEMLRHFRHGNRHDGQKRGHVGRFTFLAEMAGASFLPMKEDGTAFELPVSAAVPGKSAKVKAANPDKRSSYVVELERDEADAIYGLLIAAPICVTGVHP